MSSHPRPAAKCRAQRFFLSFALISAPCCNKVSTCKTCRWVKEVGSQIVPCEIAMMPLAEASQITSAAYVCNVSSGCRNQQQAIVEFPLFKLQSKANSDVI